MMKKKKPGTKKKETKIFPLHRKDNKRSHKKKSREKTKKISSSSLPSEEVPMRLNKYLAHAGICSRREADQLILSGSVKVNGQTVTQLGVKVIPGKDKVHYGGQLIKPEIKRYILLNKPKDYVVTVDDPHNRKTVLHLIQGACKERVYPVGRLDRKTTGLLLLTNDGELAGRLMHPRYKVKKIYQVTTDRNVKKEDLNKLTEGIVLEEGVAKADRVSYVGDSKKEIGVEIHIGWNRVVRRMFEALGYKVIKLDRIFFAGLTKKNLPRGKWRFLTSQEVGFLYKNAGMIKGTD